MFFLSLVRHYFLNKLPPWEVLMFCWQNYYSWIEHRLTDLTNAGLLSFPCMKEWFYHKPSKLLMNHSVMPLSRKLTTCIPSGKRGINLLKMLEKSDHASFRVPRSINRPMHQSIYWSLLDRHSTDTRPRYTVTVCTQFLCIICKVVSKACNSKIFKSQAHCSASCLYSVCSWSLPVHVEYIFN